MIKHSLSKYLGVASILLGTCLATSVSAQNLYMNNISLKSDLEWLNTQGVIDISTSTWPLTNSEIRYALANAKVESIAQQKILDSLEASLNQVSKTYGNTNISVGGKAYVQGNRALLPQTFADDHLARQQASVYVRASQDNWEAKLQANLKNDNLVKDVLSDDKDVSFEGSYIAGTMANQWLVAGVIPTWWGPGHEGSLIRGDATLPVAGVTMQRDRQSASTSPYLSWIGPWQYQLFAGQLNDYTAVPETKLLGTRLTARPWPWLEVGASRSIMWGGEGRPQSASSFFDALLGTKDNGSTGNPDPSNQLAGIDARINLATLSDISGGIYGQYVGEDEAGGFFSKTMYLAGVDYASTIDLGANDMPMPYQIYAEYTDTRTNSEVRGISYAHSIYTDGYYQQGYPLGHALGGDARSVATGARLWADSNNTISTKLQYAKVNQSNKIINKAFPASDTLKILDVSWDHQLQPKTQVSTRLWAVDSDLKDTDVGASIEFELSSF